MIKDLIKKLTEAYGPSGDERNIRQMIREEIQEVADELIEDVMGNLIAIKKGTGRRIMIAAHMDQIGMIITHIDEKGFLRFAAVGGVSVQNSIHRRIRFKNGMTGVIGFESEINDVKDIQLARMYIDIGASNRSEAEKQIHIGDVAIYDTCFTESNGKYTSGAMDDRIGCAIAIEVMKRLKQSEHEIYFVFTTQEEVGLRGAKTAAYTVNPQMAIAIDVTLTGDTPKARLMSIKLGAGPAVKVKDNSIMCHPKVIDQMVKAAEAISIPYQMEVLTAGGTDSGAIHLSRSGVPSGVLSIPCRYVHSANEMVDAGDVENGVALLVQLLQGTIEL